MMGAVLQKVFSYSSGLDEPGILSGFQNAWGSNLSCWDELSVNLLRLMIAWSNDNGESTLCFQRRSIFKFLFLFSKIIFITP